MTGAVGRGASPHLARPRSGRCPPPGVGWAADNADLPRTRPANVRTGWKRCREHLFAKFEHMNHIRTRVQSKPTLRQVLARHSIVRPVTHVTIHPNPEQG